MYEKKALVAFGARLRLLRRLGLLTQVQLAERARVSQATISRVERGEYPTLTAGAVRQLAWALKCVPEWLLKGTGFVPLEQVPYQWRTKPTWKEPHDLDQTGDPRLGPSRGRQARTDV